MVFICFSKRIKLHELGESGNRWFICSSPVRVGPCRPDNEPVLNENCPFNTWQELANKTISNQNLSQQTFYRHAQKLGLFLFKVHSTIFGLETDR